MADLKGGGEARSAAFVGPERIHERERVACSRICGVFLQVWVTSCRRVSAWR
jgi:hypothetical protein